MSEPESIVITGASNGIGRALALACAEEGIVLLLTGRDTARLEETAQLCREAGAAVETARLDVTDRQAMQDWLLAMDDRHPVSLVIANAGISAGFTGEAGESPELVERIFRTNIDGVAHTVLPLLPRMKFRRYGQIAIMSSLAALRPLPSAPAYSTSKAAVRCWGEALRGHLRGSGVSVSVICPGWVESGITAKNRFPMPLLMKADHAAAIIRRGLAKRKPVIGFPRRLYYPLLWLSWLPGGLTDIFFTRLPEGK